MPIRVSPGVQQQLISHVLTELAARKSIEDQHEAIFQSDLCDWAEANFFIPHTARPVRLPLHQKAIFRFFFTRGANRHFPFQTVVYSTIKKSGKSTSAGIVSRWFAETQTRYGEILAIGNDLEQAKERSFKEVKRSIELTPGYNFSKDVLPGRWVVQKTGMRCFLTGSTIKAIAVDAKGEAGGQQALTVWTELWGAENVEARRFWDEMTPIPTVPDSLRMVETYAGYDGESELLHGLYDVGMNGHQLTAGELAEMVCRPGVIGEEFQDFVECWHETQGNPEILIPIWVNETASYGMYWDSGLNARRMPWQHMYRELTPEQIARRPRLAEEVDFTCGMCFRHISEHDIGVTADQYYAAQQQILTPQAYQRLHENLWVGAESAFVPMESWDACGQVHSIPFLADGSRVELVMGVDAAVTGDCFGAVVVERCKEDSDCVDIRALKKWDPKESGGVIDLQEPEDFIRRVSKVNNIVQICYDPFQMENMAQRLRKDAVAWLEPFNQVGDRSKADSQLYDMIIGRRLHYEHAPGCPGSSSCSCMIAPMREHIANANAKMQTNEDSKLRIVKKASGRKIDLAVALSMAVARCMYLRLDRKKAAT